MLLQLEHVAGLRRRRHRHGGIVLDRAWNNLVPLVYATSRRFVIRLTVAIVGELMNEIADAAVLHLDLLDLLVLVRTVPIGAALVQLALRFPVVALHGVGLLLAVRALVDRLFLLQLQQHVLLFHVHLQALLIQRILQIVLEMAGVLLI